MPMSAATITTPSAAPTDARTTTKAPARRKLTEVPLSLLSLSPLNVRKHGAREIASLAQSIRSHGLLQPLIVRRDGDGYAVLAGGRRLKALHQIAKADDTADPVPVIVVTGYDDASAIEASLAENIERLPMDELDQYAAFAALVKEGRSEAAIADAFGVTDVIVRRRLALARLIPDIHRLYRAGAIDAETLKLLTLAPRERQKAYVALARDPEAQLPPRWQLKAWLLGGAEIDTRHALFDEKDYKGDIGGDLFGEARYFLDADQFWRLQNEAIARLRDDLTAKGWAAVDVIGPAEAFYPHQWQEVRKTDGGHAVIAVTANGKVEVMKGLMRPEDARKAQRRNAKADEAPVGDEAPASAASDRPELSAPLANYVDLVRLVSVKAALIKEPKIALRVLVAHLLGSSAHITIAAEPAAAMNEATAAAIAALPASQAASEAKEIARALLGLAEDDPLIARGYDPTRTMQILETLLALSDAEVVRIAALVITEALALGTGMIDRLGALLAVDCRKGWQADDALLDLVRDREVTGALLADVIGDKAAVSYLTDTGPKKKEIIRAALTGKDRKKVENWQPRWLAFPQGRYTDRQLTARSPAAA